MKILPGLCIFALLACSCGSNRPAGDAEISKLIARMTLDQKVRMVVGTCVSRATPPEVAPGVKNRADYPGGESTLVTKNQVPGAAGDGYSIPELGIPAIVYADGPAGLRIDPRREGDTTNTYFCTAFPTATLLASAWDTDLVERVGAAIGEEVLHYGVDILLAPGMNIQRNPLTGRNFEYYSEDPLVAGKTAAAYVRGVQSQGVGTSVKHFAVNNQELFRNGIDAVVSERALREIYLRGFEIAVREGRPWTVMSSYNKINGTYASENEWLLQKVLRDEWGFDGFVMTDWWGADDPVRQMAAGNDLLMPGSPNQIEEIKQAVLDGKLPQEVLDRNVARILRVIMQTPRMKGIPYDNAPDLLSHAAVSREAACEGMVLLYNNGALPLAGGQTVALFGNYAYDTQPGGSGSGYVNRAYKITLDKGLEEGGYTVVPALAEAYRSHIAAEKSKLPPEYFWVVPTASEMQVSDKQIAASAGAGLAIVTIGRMSGEGGDRTATPGDYLLSEQEKSLLSRVYRTFHAKGKKVVVVLNIGAPVELTGLEECCDAILLAWLPGQEAGYAIADILSGAVNPSGKLPVSLARRYEDIPSSRNFGISPGETNAVRYEEDLLVGYRYFAGAGVKPLYPFGYGLSYTQFAYDAIRYEDGAVTVTVRNCGDVTGREAVQLYVEKPVCDEGRPARELCGFAKTGLLAPGAVCEVCIPVEKDMLRQFVNGSWQLVPGTYTFHAAASSEDLRLSVQQSLFIP